MMEPDVSPSSPMSYMNNNNDMQDVPDDEAWINQAIEPLKAAGEAPVFIESTIEPSKDYLSRCRQSARRAWSLHRLKAEAQQTPAEAVGLTLWLLRLTDHAGLKLRDAMAHFNPHPDHAFKDWPVAALGAFIQALGLPPDQVRIQLGLDWFWQTESDQAAAVAAWRHASSRKGHAPPLDFQAADDLITLECSSHPHAEQIRFKQWLEDVTEAIKLSTHEAA